MKEVLLTRAIRILLCLPVFVGVIWLGGMWAGMAATEAWELLLKEARSLDAAYDCPPATMRIFEAIQAHGSPDLVERIANHSCLRAGQKKR
jgi:hypothetical protein